MDQFKFANEPIDVGDILRDTSDGPVIVLELNASRILARLLGKDQRRVSYSYKGIQGRRDARTLFWQDPFVVEPMKNSADWDLQRRFLLDINKTFASYLRAGQAITLIDDAEDTDT